MRKIKITQELYDDYCEIIERVEEQLDKDVETITRLKYMNLEYAGMVQDLLTAAKKLHTKNKGLEYDCDKYADMSLTLFNRCAELSTKEEITRQEMLLNLTHQI